MKITSAKRIGGLEATGLKDVKPKGIQSFRMHANFAVTVASPAQSPAGDVQIVLNSPIEILSIRVSATAEVLASATTTFESTVLLIANGSFWLNGETIPATPGSGEWSLISSNFKVNVPKEFPFVDMSLSPLLVPANNTGEVYNVGLVFYRSTAYGGGDILDAEVEIVFRYV